MSEMTEDYRRRVASALRYAESRKEEGATSHKKEEDLALPEVDDTIPDGYIAMSSAFGVRVPKNVRDIAVKVYSDDAWPERVRMFIPEPIEGYIWPTKELSMFLVGLMHNDRVLLHGEAGTGKSSLAEQVCARLRIPFMRVNCREDMESSALFGSITVEDGSIGWVPGPAEELGRCGGVLQVDEISAAPPGINMAMQWMLEDRGKIFLADKPGKPEDKMVSPVDTFRIVATDNTRLQGDTSGGFAGTQVQNSAMLDRFTNVIQMDYPPKKDEEKMLTARTDVPKDLAKRIVQVAGLIRAAFREGSVNYPLSPRGTLEWARKACQIGDVQLAFHSVYFNKLIDDDRRVVESLYNRVFPESTK